MQKTKQQEGALAWARWAIAALAFLGSALTGYLTYTKATATQTAICTEGSGCDLVLQSSYASLFGVPLSAFGLGLYLALLFLAVLPGIDRWRWAALFGLSLFGVSFSAYLIYLLTYEIVAVCLYCIASAGVMASIFVLTLLGHRWEKPDNLVIGGLGVVLLGMGLIFGVYNLQKGTAPPQDNAVALAKHLRVSGAKFYGASWCPHCKDQKQLFGEAAQRFIPYIECSPGGRDAPPARVCLEANIQGYPTWEVGGRRLEGPQSLAALAQYSGFKPEQATSTPGQNP